MAIRWKFNLYSMLPCKQPVNCFYLAIRAAYIQSVDNRLGHLLYHVREYYWLDINRLNEIYRYKGEEFGSNEQVQYLPRLDSLLVDRVVTGTGGYLAGNLGAGRIDFRFFALGNLMATFPPWLANSSPRQLWD